VIPSLKGVLARQLSLEVIPVCLLVGYIGLLGVYLLAIRTAKPQVVPAAAAHE